MPIVDTAGEVLGVAQIINKTDGTPVFTNEDQEVNLLSYCKV